MMGTEKQMGLADMLKKRKMKSRPQMPAEDAMMSCGGKVKKKMKAGGKVRGAGCVKKGVRTCKMR